MKNDASKIITFLRSIEIGTQRAKKKQREKLTVDDSSEVNKTKYNEKKNNKERNTSSVLMAMRK